MYGIPYRNSQQVSFYSQLFNSNGQNMKVCKLLNPSKIFPHIAHLHNRITSLQNRPQSYITVNFMRTNLNKKNNMTEFSPPIICSSEKKEKSALINNNPGFSREVKFPYICKLNEETCTRCT